MLQERWLSSMTFARRCSPAEVARIARASRVRQVQAGVEVIAEGDDPGDFFMVIDGLARVRRGAHDLAVLGPGEFFGEIALLDGSPRSATVEAVTDLDLLAVAPRQFDALVDGVVNFRSELLRTLAHRLRLLDAPDGDFNAGEAAAAEGRPRDGLDDTALAS